MICIQASVTCVCRNGQEKKKKTEKKMEKNRQGETVCKPGSWQRTSIQTTNPFRKWTKDMKGHFT